MTTFKANRKFPNPITVNDDPRSHTLALQQVIEALNIGQRRTKEVGSSYVRVSELVDVGLIEIVGSQLKLTNLGAAVAAGVTDHGMLDGLADDDHTQYLDATRHAAIDAADHSSGAAADGHVLTADGAGGAAWEAATGSSSPTTTEGDIIVRGASADDRLAVGTEGQVLSVVSGVPAWGDAASGGGAIDDGILHVQDQKASGTNGGSSSTGWNTRVLNTEVLNTITGASLASNQITLPAGTYDVFASAPCHQGETSKLCLYNVTDAAYTLIGQNQRSRATSSTDGTTFASCLGRITITGTKVFELRHYFTNALASSGLGTACTSGLVEIFAEALIRKIAAGGSSAYGALQFVAEAAVTGSAATSLTVSGLDLDADGTYFLEFKVGAVAGTNPLLYLFYNSDTTQTNYYYQAQASNASSTYSGRGNDASLTQLLTSSQVTGTAKLMRDLDGKPRLVGEFTQGDWSAMRLFAACHIWTSTANITSLTITCATANGLEVGTSVRVWKIVADATIGEAANVIYDNATSGLAATDVQAAIDEVSGAIRGAYKTTAESRSSTTTLADDTDLILTLEANKKYKIDYTIWIEAAATPDFKCDWNFTGTLTSAKSVAHYPNGATASVSAGATSVSTGAYLAYGLNRVHTYNVSATQTVCHTGTLNINVGASGGVLSFRWAQNTSSATAVSVATDSAMVATEIP